jgi:DNA-binding PadR family transcriptional regulator
MQKETASARLTEIENHVLSIIWRTQPTTAYQIRHAFGRMAAEDPPVSQGTVYPAIERLKRRELVEARSTQDRRNTKQLWCTAAGEAAVRNWVMSVSGRLPNDPLRNRALALSALSPAECVDWVKKAKMAVLEDLAEVEESAQANTGALHEVVHDNARLTHLARIRWLERLEVALSRIASEAQSGERSSTN